MKFIHDTISVCDHCYRHIPGVVFEKDDKIWLTKLCQDHGEQQEIVEIDTEFYYNLTKTDTTEISSLMFESTNRCQLNCPHCYQLPDNKSTDRPLGLLLATVDSYPQGVLPMIAGAEPTMHKEIVTLATSISNKYGRTRILTNGLKFANKKFAKELLADPNILPEIGLNHWSYQGKKVHEKQLRGINNIKELSRVGDVGYTVESFDHLPEIFKEIEELADDKINVFRIRFGSFIGRSSDQERNYLSKTIKKMKELLGDDLVPAPLDDNPYHVMYTWKGIKLRIIQWPDVRNIDMEELNTGPWANFYEGPITNFVHQVIMRDAFVNNNLPKLDDCPPYYHVKLGKDLTLPENLHWKHGWTGPVEFKEFDYTIKDPRKKPLRIKKWLS
jgi:MoaA/NifB/PqqE/SkfB family radical SAM enzyme